MDCSKIGALIRTLRIKKNLTQLQLAEKIGVSDKAVSKWERGLGCPDVTLISDLSEILGVDINGLLAGEIENNENDGGNMKKLKFYVCPKCGNLITSSTDASISCCSMVLEELVPQKADEKEILKVEKIENDYFISTEHEMSKENYIHFVALLTADTIMLKRQYPEWNLETRIPCFGHGKLIWYCNCHGLLYKNI